MERYEAYSNTLPHLPSLLFSAWTGVQVPSVLELDFAFSTQDAQFCITRHSRLMNHMQYWREEGTGSPCTRRDGYHLE